MGSFVTECRDGFPCLSVSYVSSWRHHHGHPAACSRAADPESGGQLPHRRGSVQLSGPSAAGGLRCQSLRGVCCSIRLSSVRSVVPIPLFEPEAGCSAMNLQVGGVNHTRSAAPARLRKLFQNAGEDAPSGPVLPAVVQCLVRPIHRMRIPPSEPVPIDKNDPAQTPPVLSSGNTSRLRKPRTDPRKLCLCQPEKIAHVTAHQNCCCRRSINHAQSDRATINGF